MGRAPCCDKDNVKRGPWSPEEDAKLKAYIEQHGTGGNWIALPQKIDLNRCGKSCRLRWLNYLRPNIRHGGFTEEEENIICSLYISIGSRWSIIAAQLPGRTDNDIKNYWNTKLKKKLMAKQRKEQAAFLTGQGMKRESESYMMNQTPNQIIPYWAENPVAHHVYMNMHSNQDPHLGNQAHLMTRLVSKIGGHDDQFYNDPQVISYQYPMQDQLSADHYSHVLSQWSNTLEDDVNGACSVNMNPGQDNYNFPADIEVYLSNLRLPFVGTDQSYSGVDVGNSSSTTSTSAASTSWGDEIPIQNTNFQF